MEEDGKRNDLARMPGSARVLGLGRAGPPGAPFLENVSDAASGPRRGGCAPGRGATGWGRKTTQAPHHGGLPACKDKRMLFLSTSPARRGFTGFTPRFQAHRPASVGVSPSTGESGGSRTQPPRQGGGKPVDETVKWFSDATAPHGRGSDSRTGARCAHTGPGHTAARRIAQQPA